MQAESPIADSYPTSPCIQVCTLNDAGLCLGCHRRLQEIAGWGRMSAAEQRAIIRDLPQRDPRGVLSKAAAK